MNDLNVFEGVAALVVDDVALNRHQVSVLLDKIGVEVVHQAESGLAALALCDSLTPDLIVLDAHMPGMGGQEVAREIRRRFEHWIPIIIVSADVSNENIVAGIRAGGDDFLCKPVDFEILQSQVTRLLTRKKMADRLVEQYQALQTYQHRTQEERELARRLINRLVNVDMLNDPMVKLFLEPTDHFSGDLVYAARTPDNRIHVLLADSCGHGLTAALSVIPLTQPFHQMTAKGFDIPTIIKELNRRVRDYLPLPRFIAAVFVSLDVERRMVQVWNGGCPPVLFLNAEDRELRHQFVSRHLPLGVLSPEDFDPTIEHFCYGETPGSVLICSDGVSDLKDAHGQRQGLQALLNKTHVTAAGLFDALVNTVRSELNGVHPADDLALIQLDCPLPDDVYESSQGLGGISLPEVFELCDPSQPELADWSFKLKLGVNRLKVLDVLPFLAGVANRLEIDAPNQSLFIVLSELFNNALEHGLLKLDSNLKSEEGGMERYFEARITRLAALTEGEIEIEITRMSNTSGENCDKCARKLFKIVVRDTGAGFDHTQISKEMKPEHHKHGRGIALLHRLCNKVNYLGKGSEVVVYMDLQTYECPRMSPSANSQTDTRTITILPFPNANRQSEREGA